MAATQLPQNFVYFDPGIIIIPIPNLDSKAQIFDIIRQVTLISLELRLDLRTLPDAVVSTNDHGCFCIPLRDGVFRRLEWGRVLRILFGTKKSWIRTTLHLSA